MHIEDHNDDLTAEQLETLRRLDAELEGSNACGGPSAIAVAEPELARRVAVTSTIAAFALLLLLIGLQTSFLLAGVGGFVLVRSMRPLVRAMAELRRETDAQPVSSDGLRRAAPT